MRQLLNDKVRRMALTLIALAVLAVAGCSTGRYPVTGRVTYEDGSPLKEGNVMGQMGEGAASVTVQGTVRDGAFSWGTEREGDGAKPGKYKVTVIPRGLGDSEISQGMKPDVDPRATTPREFEVKASGDNVLNITVRRPK